MGPQNECEKVITVVIVLQCHGQRASSTSYGTFSLPGNRQRTLWCARMWPWQDSTSTVCHCRPILWLVGGFPWCRVTVCIPSSAMGRKSLLLVWGKGSTVEGQHLWTAGWFWITHGICGIYGEVKTESSFVCLITSHRKVEHLSRLSAELLFLH